MTFNLEEYNRRVEANVRRLRLAKDVIDEVHRYLLDPMFPQERADLLIASENLTESAFELMHAVQGLVWSKDLKAPASNHPENED